jgi:hypothetical protein
MSTNSPANNKRYCKAWYQRLKQEPAKWRAFLDHRARYKKVANLVAK